MARNILVVEDDRNISELIRMYLEKEGFEVRAAYDGGKAVEEYDKQAPDMVLLDIMLPVMDGWAVCAHIREKGKTPIIMLTAKSDVGDRITGLEMGADDYLVKPFEMKELLARINAVLRRTEIPNDTSKKLTFDKLVINLDSYELIVDGKKVDTVVCWDTFLTVELTPGTHQVTFRYTSPGLNLGLGLCGITVVVFVGWLVWKRKKS